MNLLVTGAAGYIGASFSYEALKKGFKVFGCDNFINSDETNIKILEDKFPSEFVFKKIDLSTQSEKIKNFISNKNIECVIHFASLKSVEESEKIPHEYWRNNLDSTFNVLHAMESEGIKALVFSSSASVYGHSKIQPLSEEADLIPESTYGKTKLAIESVLKDLAEKKLLNVVSLRYFNPVGSHKDGFIAESISENQSNVMPKIVRVALGLEKKFTIFGSDYKTDDGTAERDYIHIEDLISGHLDAVNYALQNNGSIELNLGTGRKVSVLELVNTFMSTNNVDVPLEFSTRRMGDVPICYADPTKSNKIINWKAKFGLKEMCEDSWMPFLNNNGS
jgi:UDP-glucose 4-epimerase